MAGTIRDQTHLRWWPLWDGMVNRCCLGAQKKSQAVSFGAGAAMMEPRNQDSKKITRWLQITVLDSEIKKAIGVGRQDKMDTLTSFCWFVLRLRRLKYHVAESVWILEVFSVWNHFGEAPPYDQHQGPGDRCHRSLELTRFSCRWLRIFPFRAAKGTNVKLEWSAGFGRLS